MPSFKLKPSLAQINEQRKNTLIDHLGIQFEEIGDDYIIATMPVDHRTHQPIGILHGGASVVLAETLGSFASSLLLDSPNSYPVGVEINANHLKSVSKGQVTGKVTPIRIGKSIHVWNIEIKNEQGELTCISRLTVMIVNR